jgi:hypothetical protein
VCPKYVAVERLKKGWRRTLREVRIVEVPSAMPAEVQFSLVKLECKNQNRLAQNQLRNQVQRFRGRIRVEGLFKQGHGLGRTLLRQEFGNSDGRRRLRSLVKGQLCLQSPTEYGTCQKEESTLESVCDRNLMSLRHLSPVLPNSPVNNVTKNGLVRLKEALTINGQCSRNFCDLPISRP